MAVIIWFYFHNIPLCEDPISLDFDEKSRRYTLVV